MSNTKDTQTAAPVGVSQLREFARILSRYKAGKTNLERRIIDNEQWWKLRHNDGAGASDAVSAWLCNVIMTKHADAMDAYPQPTVLPREADDTEEAQRLSRILPVILKNDRFRRTYAPDTQPQTGIQNLSNPDKFNKNNL